MPLIEEKDWTAPKTFSEYIERFPDHHKKWLSKRYSSYKNSDFDDLAQFLLLETFRKNRVEKFVALPKLENRPGLFFDWLNRCFKNDLAYYKTHNGALKRKANEYSVSLSNNPDADDDSKKHTQGQGIEGFLVGKSRQYRIRTENSGEHSFRVSLIGEFTAYVKKHAPHLVEHIERMPYGEKTTGSRKDLEHTQLRSLAKAFRQGKKPQKLRKPYHQRVPKRP